jgi:DNA-binding transcriptional LysR family regulator
VLSAARVIVSPLAITLRLQAPDVVLHVEESYRSDQLLERLAAGDLDLVLAPIVDDVAGLEATEILRDAYVLIVPADDELAGLRRPLEVADLAGRALVAKDCGIPTQRVLTAALAELDVAMDTVVRAHDAYTVQQLVAKGVGISVMPRLLVDIATDDIRIVPLDHLLPPRRIGLYEPAGGYRAPAVALAAAAIRGAALQPA